MSPISELKKKKIHQTQAKIRNCAHELFEAKGFNSVNFDEIADAALISRSTLYAYYENKSALYFDIHADQVREVVDQSREISSQSSGKQMILHICESLMDSFHNNWINSYVLDDFIKGNLGGLDLKGEISDPSPTSGQSELVQYRYISMKRSLGQYFGFLLGFMQTLTKNFKIGISDGSISTNILIPQAIDYIRMILVGTMDQFMSSVKR